MSQRGSILVAVLWCVALLTVIVGGALYSTHLGLTAAKNFEDKVQAHYLALAGIEKAKALIYHEAAARQKAARNHSGELYTATDAFRDVSLGRGLFRILRQGTRDEGDQLINGIRDEESRLNINTATLQELTGLKDMLPETAAAIIDWRDKDASVLAGGAERDYYASLKPPYLPRNGEIQTMREMLLIRGVTPELLLGEDFNANGLFDPEENDGDKTLPEDNHNDSLEAGWFGVFCVQSAVANRNAGGQARINVQTASETELTGVKGITTEIAKAIVAYRNRQKLENIVDLLEVANLAPERPQNPPGGPGDGPPRQTQAPQSGGAVQTVGPKLINEELFQDICDDVTVDNNATLKGVVNINTASAAVLSLLTGLNEQLAQAIINHRSSAGYFPSIGAVMKVPGMTREVFRQISPRITVRSETFRITSEGRVASTGARERMEVVIRLIGTRIETLSYRENL